MTRLDTRLSSSSLQFHARVALRILMCGAAAWAFLVIMFGPFSVQRSWFRIGSRDTTRALLIVALSAALYVRLSGGDRVRRELERLDLAILRLAAPLAIALSLLVFSLGVKYGTFVAGGADTYGYVSQAELFEKGTLHVTDPMADVVPWPDALQTLTPLGYRLGPGRQDIVPYYPPGLPLVMVAFRAVAGKNGQFYVCPVLGALAVWLSFCLGRRLTGQPTVGLAAALVLATSAPFLFMLMPPMSDVPAMSAWTLAILLALMSSVYAALAAGLVAGLAVLIRPNLAPLAAVVGIALTWQSLRHHRGAWRVLARPLVFAAALAPSVAVLAVLNHTWYGSAWSSGYGDPRLMYAFGHLRTNASQFTSWMVQTGCGYVLLGTLTALGAWPRSILPAYSSAPTRFLAAGVVVVVWLSYLFYTPYAAWWFLRFLLPMWPLTIVLAAALVSGALEWVRVPGREMLLVVLAALLFAGGYRTADVKGVFNLQKEEARCTATAEWLNRNTEATAVFLCGEHSGMLRRYTGRTTIRFEFLDPAWLDRSAPALSHLGHHEYIVLDEHEVPVFRRRFAGTSELGRLAWQPAATISHVVVYDVASVPDVTVR